jgi:hypothetical protein
MTVFRDIKKSTFICSTAVVEVRRGYEARNFAILIIADDIAIYGMAEAATLVKFMNTQGIHAHQLLCQLL